MGLRPLTDMEHDHFSGDRDGESRHEEPDWIDEWKQAVAPWRDTCAKNWRMFSLCDPVHLTDDFIKRVEQCLSGTSTVSIDDAVSASPLQSKKPTHNGEVDG